jgi:Fic family protein
MLNDLKIIYHIDNKDLSLIKSIDDKLNLVKIRPNLKTNMIRTKARVRSVYSSLAIEANSLSLNDVNNIIANKLVLGLPKDIQEVKNANQVYEHMKEYNFKNQADLIKAHTIFMYGFDDDNGKYRNHGEGVKRNNKIIFKAPDSVLVPELMNELFKYLNDNQNIHPFIMAAIFHYYLVYIHPFSDGNGRLARFWLNLILTTYNDKFNYIPLEEEIYLEQEKYYQAIDKCHNNGNANEFIKFILNILDRTLNKVLNNKLNEKAQLILKYLQSNPNVNTTKIAINLKMSDRTVRRYLNILLNNNLIEASSLNKNDPTRTYKII